jgi:hypothetical protein
MPCAIFGVKKAADCGFWTTLLFHFVSVGIQMSWAFPNMRYLSNIVGSTFLECLKTGFIDFILRICCLEKIMRSKNWIKKQWNFQYKGPRAGFGPRVIKIQGGYLPNLLTHSVQIPNHNYCDSVNKLHFFKWILSALDLRDQGFFGQIQTSTMSTLKCDL